MTHAKRQPADGTLVSAAKGLVPGALRAVVRPAIRVIAPGFAGRKQQVAIEADTTRFPFGHYLASEKLGVVLCAIPKCGCSTTKYWFARAIKGQDFKLPVGGIHRFCRKRFALESKPPVRVAALLEQCVKFAIVRDPLERLASAYGNKFVPRPFEVVSTPVIEAVQLGFPAHVLHDSTRTIRRSRGEREIPVSSRVDYRRGITFREFVQYVVRTPNAELDPHWRPQIDFVSPVKLDLIAPLEQIGWAIAEVQRRAGITGPTPETRQPKSAARGAVDCLADVPSGEFRKQKLMPTAGSLFDDDLREAVRRRYAGDIELHARACSEVGKLALESGSAVR